MELKIGNTFIMGKVLKHIFSRLSPSLMLVLAGWLSFACTSDPKYIGPDNPDEKGETAYVSLKLNTGMDRISAETRSHRPDPGDPDYRIDTVRMVLYGPDDHVHYTFDFSIRTNYDGLGEMFMEGPGVSEEYGHDLYTSSQWADEQPSLVTYARKVAKNNYRMLIILNSTGSGEEGPPPAVDRVATRANNSMTTERIMEITKVGQPLSLLYEPVYIDPDHLFGGPVTRSGRPDRNASIMMVNYQGLIPVSENQLGDSSDDANQNPVFARVERYLSKVTVITSDPDGNIEYTGTDGAEISQYSTIWGLECTNKRTYWMRRLAPVIDPNGAPVNYLNLETPNYDPAVPPARINLYAWDPNFGMGTAEDPYLSGDNGGTAAQRRAQFNYLAYAGEGFSPGVKNQFGEMEYALENTMSDTEQNDDVMTRVIVGIPLSPVPDEISPGNSYYAYLRPGAQPGEELYIYGYKMYEYAYDPSLIPDEPEYEGLEEIIALLKTEGIDLENVNGKGGFSRHGLTYYDNGLHYYTVPIRHFGEFTGTAGEKAYGRYGMVRNNQYVVKIKSVSGPGAPSVIDDPAYLSAEIGILPWLAHAQESDLGGGVTPIKKTYVIYDYYYRDPSDIVHYLGRRYDRNVSVGDAIDYVPMRNAMRTEIPDYQGYGNGFLMEPAPADVSEDPEQNLVKIIYEVMPN